MIRRLALGLCLLCLAATAAPEPAPLFPFVLPWDDDSPGLTDLSGWLPKPAGQLGSPRVGPDGHLYTGSQRLRLNGVDLAFSAAFPTHDQAEKVAGRLAKFGINILRFHIMDMRRFPDGLLARNAKNTRDLDPEALDRLDYFSAQLTKHGVYTYLCLLNYRPFNAADGLPAEIEQLGGPFQGRHIPGFWDPAQMALQKEYARNLLTHRNAYTHLTYAEDPAVAMVELNNENGLLHAWLADRIDELPAVFQNQLRDQWNAWLREQYRSTDALRQAWGRHEQPLGAELLANADFGQNLDGWVLERHDPAMATATVQADGPPAVPGAKAVCLDEAVIGTQSWHVRFEQYGQEIVGERGYAVTFWAKADPPGPLRVSLAQTRPPYSDLGWSTVVKLTTQWQRYRVIASPSQSYDRARLVFDPPVQVGRTWLAGLSLRPGGLLGLPPGQNLGPGTVANLGHADRGERPPEVSRDWVRFLWQVEDRYWQTLYRYLKDDLHLKAPVIGTVVGCSTPNLMAKLDCIDYHAYWQHPQFPGRPWDPDNWRVNNVSMVNARGGLLTGLALHRVLSKPMCTTEYGYPAPNTFGSEGALLRGAYGALQDWDYLGTSRYAQRNDFDLRRIRGYFDIDQHPTKMMTQIPAAALFLRGDVAVAKQRVVATLSREQELDLLPRQHSWSLIDLGPRGVPPEATLVHRVDLAVDGQTPPPSALRPEDLKLPTDEFVSDTGELDWNLRRPQRGVVTVNTPRSKAVIGYSGGERYDLGGLVIEPGPTRQDGWSALTVTAMQGALDGAAARWLVTASGYVENTNMGWKDATKTSVGRNWGSAPTLVEGIPARITLPAAARIVTVWALDERGQRRTAVPVTKAADGRLVVAIGPEWQTLWYEVEVR